MGQANKVGVRELAAQLRARHLDHGQIARIVREQFKGMSARKAMRVAWGWTQDQARAEWSDRFGESLA